ncbi:MAG: DNA repair protein RadA [Anaerolineales bacterium]
MAKSQTIFICNNCGHESLKWAGKCPECGRWNSFEEVERVNAASSQKKPTSSTKPGILSEIEFGQQEERIITGMRELDRVLGGGIYPASVNLIAGDPGIGKSTLLLQLAGLLTRKNISTLYITGEESLHQIRGRYERLGLKDIPIPVLAETELENILVQIEKDSPKVVIIDSIQSIFSSNISGAPGNVGQVRECAARLFQSANENNWSLFLVGHITKEGGIAGPKILEHMVDVVIYFEGDSLYRYRILRSLKNRFGATNELGLFFMEKEGLKEVENPSRLFLSDGQVSQAGTSVICSFEGTRPILGEVQALVSRSNYGVPQRTVSGFDQRRLALILAILEKHCGLNFGFQDVFVKIAGGLRIDDPGIDLGIACAIYSSLIDRPLKDSAVYVGELGLNGDIRPVSQLDRRIQEAIHLGFGHVYISAMEDKNIRQAQIIRIRNIREIIQPRKSGNEEMENN